MPCFSEKNTKPLNLIYLLRILIFIYILFPLTFISADKGGNDKSLILTRLHICVASAQTDSEKNITTFSKWPHESSDLLPDPALVFGRLPNGFRYVLMENNRPENRVSMHLNVQTGSLNESDKQQGLAHFLEHMLFCGSEHFKPGELVKYFQTIGMKFGADANAHTGFSETVYDILLPDGDIKSIKQGLVVLKDYAESALLLQSEIDRERGVILAEKRTRDSASYRTFVATLNFDIPETRISKRLPIGKEDVIKNADRKLLKDYYDTWYRPENIILVMVGNFDAKSASTLIENSFSGLSARAPKGNVVPTGDFKHTGIKTFYHFEKEAGNATVSIEVVKKINPVVDSAGFQKTMLVKKMANSIVQDRLDILTDRPDTPFTSASVSSGIYFKQIEFAEITAHCDPSNWKKALAILEQTLRKAIKYGFTESELEIAQKDFLSNLENNVKEASTRNSGNLSRRIIGNLNKGRVFQSPEQKKNLFSALINSLSLENLHDSFAKTWSPDHRLVLLTGNAMLKGDVKPEDLILAAFKKSCAAKVSKPLKIKPAVFPYLPEPKNKGRIAGKTEISDLEIIQVDFENNVRLNLKKTDFKANEVLVKLVFGSGRSSEPVKRAGLAELSAAVINGSGLGALKKDEIKNALAGKNTTVGFGFDQDSFFFEGKTVSSEVPLLFQLLYAHLIDPGYREDALTLTMERFKQRHAALSHSIDGAVLLYGKRFLAGGDSRFGIPPYEEMSKLTLENVISWIDLSLKKDLFEVSVVGDFDAGTVIKEASKYFGSLKQRNSHKIHKRDKSLKFPVSQTLEIPVATKIPKGLVIVAFPTEDLWNIHRTRRLSALANVFSERLRKQIREKLGAVYSPFAYNRPSRAYPDYGIFSAFIHVDPEKTDLIQREVKKIISDLAQKEVGEKELARAIGPTLTGIKDMQRNNGYWLNTVLSGSKEHPEQIKWSRTIQTDYASITAGELLLIAKKYLKNDKAAIIIIKPEK